MKRLVETFKFRNQFLIRTGTPTAGMALDSVADFSSLCTMCVVRAMF